MSILLFVHDMYPLTLTTRPDATERQSAEKYKNNEVLFEHSIAVDEVLASEEEIRGIDASFVQERYMTQAFIGFVFDYATIVSHARGWILEEVLRHKGRKSVIRCLTFSDISYALVLYINNYGYWIWSHKDTLRKARNKTYAVKRAAREARDAALPPGTRATAAAREEEPIPEDEPQEDLVEQVFKIGNRSKKLRFGLCPKGRALYKALELALQAVGKGGWDDLWSAWWAANNSRLESLSSQASAKKRKRDDPTIEAMDHEDEDGLGAGVVSFEDDEEEDDDHDSDGGNPGSMMPR